MRFITILLWALFLSLSARAAGENMDRTRPQGLSPNATAIWKLLIDAKSHYSGLYHLQNTGNEIEESEGQRLTDELLSIPLVQYLVSEGQKNRGEITSHAYKEAFERPEIKKNLKRHNQTLQSFEQLLARSRSQKRISLRTEAENHATVVMQSIYGRDFNLERGSLYTDQWNSLVWDYIENPPPTTQWRSISRAAFENWKLGELQRLKEWLNADVKMHLQLTTIQPDNTWSQDVGLIDLQPEAVHNPENPQTILHFKTEHLQWKMRHIPVEEQKNLPTKKSGKYVMEAAEWFLQDPLGKYWALKSKNTTYVHDSFTYQISFKPSFSHQEIWEWFKYFESPDQLRKIATQLLNGFIMSATEDMIKFIEHMPWQEKAEDMLENLAQHVRKTDDRLPSAEDFENALQIKIYNLDADSTLKNLEKVVDDLAWSRMKDDVGFWHKRDHKDKRLPQFRLPDSAPDNSRYVYLNPQSVPSFFPHDMTNNVPPNQPHVGLFHLTAKFLSFKPRHYLLIDKDDIKPAFLEKILLSEDSSQKPHFSLAAIKPTEVYEQWLTIPTAENAILKGIRLRSVTGQQLEEKDFEVYRSKVSGSYIVKLLKPGQDLKYVYVDTDFDLTPLQKERIDLPSFDEATLAPLIQELRVAGITTLADGLVEVLAGGPLSPQDLVHTISLFSLYSFVAENPDSTDLGPFSEFKKFLNSEGTLCFICNGSAGLLAEMLNRLFKSSPDHSARVVHMFARKGGKVGVPGHAQVELLFQGRRILLLDPTALKKDPRNRQQEDVYDTPSSKSSRSDEEVLSELIESLKIKRQTLLTKGEKLEPSSKLPAQTPFSAIYQLSGQFLNLVSSEKSTRHLTQAKKYKRLIKVNEETLKPWLNAEVMHMRISTTDAQLIYFHRALKSELNSILDLMKTTIYYVGKVDSCEKKLN